MDRRKRGFRQLIAVAIAAAALVGAPAFADVSDIAVKAAFLPRFARYVTWPPNAPASRGPMALCVIGDDPFGSLLNQSIASQQVDGRGFVVKHPSSAADASDCAIAFVDGPRTAETLAELGRRPILTVTDARSGADRGVIHFELVDGRVRFFIDNGQARARGLTISSRLLALAIGVNER